HVERPRAAPAPPACVHLLGPPPCPVFHADAKTAATCRRAVRTNLRHEEIPGRRPLAQRFVRPARLPAGPGGVLSECQPAFSASPTGWLFAARTRRVRRPVHRRRFGKNISPANAPREVISRRGGTSASHGAGGPHGNRRPRAPFRSGGLIARQNRRLDMDNPT